jgi:hypothetical protein
MPERLDDEHFRPVASHPMLEIRESSPCCCPWGRYLCHNFRQAKFGVYPPLVVATGSRQGWPDAAAAAPMFVVDRPFQCTVVCCCVLFNPPVVFTQLPTGRAAPPGARPEEVPVDTVGKVELAWEWWNCWWPCLLKFHVTDLRAGPHAAPAYVVEVPRACAHDCVNFCAPTCFNPVFRMPVRDAASGAVVGELQNQWPGCNARGLCLGNSQADNYVVKFPPRADPVARANLISALMLVNLIFFERRANQKK